MGGVRQLQYRGMIHSRDRALRQRGERGYFGDGITATLLYFFLLSYLLHLVPDLKSALSRPAFPYPINPFGSLHFLRERQRQRNSKRKPTTPPTPPPEI